MKVAQIYKNKNSEPLKLAKLTFLVRSRSPKLDFTLNLSGSKMINFQKSQALTSHFESFWSTVPFIFLSSLMGLKWSCSFFLVYSSWLYKTIRFSKKDTLTLFLNYSHVFDENENKHETWITFYLINVLEGLLTIWHFLTLKKICQRGLINT